jgi:hypothetical protein
MMINTAIGNDHVIATIRETMLRLENRSDLSPAGLRGIR